MTFEEQPPKPTHETPQSLIARDIESYKGHIKDQREKLAHMRAELAQTKKDVETLRAQLALHPDDEVAKARYDEAIKLFADLHHSLFGDAEYIALMHDLKETEMELEDVKRAYRGSLNS